MDIKRYSRVISRCMVLMTTLFGCPSIFAQTASNQSQVIVFTGTVRASPCTVDVPASGIIVTLPTVTPDEVLQAGAGPDKWGDFQIGLSDCGATTARYIATFTGDAAEGDSSKFKNTGDAANVDIELQMIDGTSIGPGTTYTGGINNQTATLQMRARPYSIQGNGQPGSILGLINVTFTYE